MWLVHSLLMNQGRLLSWLREAFSISRWSSQARCASLSRHSPGSLGRAQWHMCATATSHCSNGPSSCICSPSSAHGDHHPQLPGSWCCRQDWSFERIWEDKTLQVKILLSSSQCLKPCYCTKEDILPKHNNSKESNNGEKAAHSRYLCPRLHNWASMFSGNLLLLGAGVMWPSRDQASSSRCGQVSLCHRFSQHAQCDPMHPRRVKVALSSDHTLPSFTGGHSVPR